jgi:hypothetical protein
MKRIFRIAFLVCLILFILAIFISPVVDSQPSALRAQQWLSIIVAMFSFALQLVIFILKISVRPGTSHEDAKYRPRVAPPDLTCCLLC